MLVAALPLCCCVRLWSRQDPPFDAGDVRGRRVDEVPFRAEGTGQTGRTPSGVTPQPEFTWKAKRGLPEARPGR